MDNNSQNTCKLDIPCSILDIQFLIKKQFKQGGKNV